jgi:RNA polymerase sigma-70 factor (ECF subfamily)
MVIVMSSAQINRLDDGDLMARVIDGDVRAFEAIYDRYCSQVLTLAMRVTSRRATAEEATQDAFLTLWRGPQHFDPSRGTLKTWLLTIVRNRSIDLLRSGARHTGHVEFDQILAERLEAAAPADQHVDDHAEQYREARDMLASLPREQLQVIELAFFEGLTHPQIAAQVGIPLGTVKGRQRLALTKLRRAFAIASQPALG